PSLPARSSKARATAVMASAPPRRSYREPSTVPTSCALVINDSATFPASRTVKPCHRGRVNLYRLLTGQTEGPAGAVGRGAAQGAAGGGNHPAAGRNRGGGAAGDSAGARPRPVPPQPVTPQRASAPPPGGRPRHPDLRHKLLMPGAGVAAPPGRWPPER